MSKLQTVRKALKTNPKVVVVKVGESMDEFKEFLQDIKDSIREKQ